MKAYYNEFEPYAAAWLRNLIAEGLIAPGDVDDRSIADVQPGDLAGYTQCHFFAGLGGWSLALRLAGWPDDRPVWTGSCPCQPFSNSGKRQGIDDRRHLWPEFKRLIEERQPPVVFGEQVASAASWLALVRGDLEAMGYAMGAMPIEAASAGADDRRDRYWFVADRNYTERGADDSSRDIAHGSSSRREEDPGNPTERGALPLVDAADTEWGSRWTESEFRRRGFFARLTSFGGRQYVGCPDGKWRALPPPRVRWLADGLSTRVPQMRAIGNAIDPRVGAEVIRAYQDL